MIVDGPAGPREVDARPSDAVNLALVAGVAIRMDSRLFSDEGQARSADVLAYPTGSAELAAEAPLQHQELMRELGITDLPPDVP